MVASKKIFCPKIYPLDHKDTSKRWFIRFYYKIEGGVSVKKVVVIPKKLDAAARLKWAKDYIKKLELYGYKPIKKQFKCFNKTIELLFDVLNKKKKLADKSYSQFKSHIGGLNEYCELKHIYSINERAIKGFIEYLQDVKLIENKTINHYARTLKNLFEKLLEQKLIKKNPFSFFKRLPTKRAFSEHFEDKEIKLILTEIQKSKPFLFLPAMTILHCATRNGREMPNIKILDIDFENNKLWINDQYSKNGEKESVFIPNNLMALFKAHKIDTYPKDFYLFGSEGVPSPKRVGCNFFQRHFRVVCENLNIYTPRKGFYRLKNSLAVKMVKLDYNKFAIQKQFRHKSFDTTEKYLNSLRIDEFQELKEFSFF